MDQTHLFLHTSLRLPRSLSVCQDVHLYRIEFVVFSAKVVILFTIFLNYLENYNVFQMSTHIHQFSSVQLLSRVRLFVIPWTTARQASLSITNSWSSLKPMSIESVMPCSHLILCRPLLLLPSYFPSIRVFSNESVLRVRWPTYWSFSFSISSSNEYSGLIFFRMDWLDLLAVQRTLKSLLQNHSLKASFLWWSAVFRVHLHLTPVLLPGKSHGQRSLVSCSPWGCNWATSVSLSTFMHWRRKWQPTPVFLPGESQGHGSLVGCCLWCRTESDTTESI